MPLILQPADVLVVRGGGDASWWIRFGAALKGLPNQDGHVAMMHHYDSSGVPWGIEGRPGGVGWVDLRPYLRDPYMLNNCGQPGRTDHDRNLAAKDMEALLGTKYDWEAILGDGFDDLHLQLWNLPGFKVKPGAVVCSSLAGYVYAKRGWAHPDLGRERYCQPGDWDDFIIKGRYSRLWTTGHGGRSSWPSGVSSSSSGSPQPVTTARATPGHRSSGSAAAMPAPPTIPRPVPCGRVRYEGKPDAARK